MSALPDNVTTVLPIAPVTLFIADALELDPVQLLISEDHVSLPTPNVLDSFTERRL